MMKKLTALLLALTMVLSLVTVASAEGGTIAEVALSHEELTVGQPLPELTAPAGANYTVNYWWQDLTGGATPTVVELGHRYRLQMEIRPAEGYAFATDAVLLVNGVRVLGNDKAPIQIRPNLIYAMIDYSLLPTVDKVEIFFDEPIQAGPVPEFTVPADANYTITAAQWQEKDAIYDDEIPEITELKEGVAYTLVLLVRPVAGYEIGDGVKLYLNGKETAISYKSWSYVQYQCDVTIGAAPEAPVITASVSAASGQPRLTWDAVEGAEKYEIWRARTEGGTFYKMWTQTGTSYVNTTAEGGKTYWYKVRAVAADGTAGEFSAVAAVTCAPARPAPALFNRTASGLPGMTWKAVEGAEKYEIWRAASKGGTFYKMWTQTGTSYTNTTAKVGKTYWYKVRAVAADGTVGPFSTVKYITCDLPQPTGMEIRLDEGGQLCVSWDAVPGAMKYAVWCADAQDGSYTLRCEVGEPLYKDPAPVSGCWYKVRAILPGNSYAAGAFGEAVSLSAE